MVESGKQKRTGRCSEKGEERMANNKGRGDRIEKGGVGGGWGWGGCLCFFF